MLPVNRRGINEDETFKEDGQVFMDNSSVSFSLGDMRFRRRGEFPGRSAFQNGLQGLSH